jgi:hypothetical protein
MTNCLFYLNTILTRNDRNFHGKEKGMSRQNVNGGHHILKSGSRNWDSDAT